MDLDILRFFTENEIARTGKEAIQAEESGSLTEWMFNLAYRKQLFHLFVPQTYGGRQCDLPEALEWLEATSWLDGSLGWTTTLGAGAGLFGAFMDPELAQSVFDDPRQFITGSGFPGGKAAIKNDGYQVSGQWKYATGIDHATLITATCYITQNGKVRQEGGEPILKAMAFYSQEVNWQSNWQSYGLKGTGSHNFEVDNINIPTKRSFTIQPSASKVEGLLYKYPFDPFAQATLATSLIGMAGRFHSEAKELILSRNNTKLQEELPEPVRTELSSSQNKFREARNLLYVAVEDSWKNLDMKDGLNQTLESRVSDQSRVSCKKALESTQQIYPFLGMSAINPKSVINRCWRDLHTASQHMLLTPGNS